MKQIKHLFVALALMASTTFAWADDSGSCGDNLTWSYVESTNTLTISGSGSMTNYNFSSPLAPWNTYKDEMTTVVIESGATSIGDYAFQLCSALTSITIPESVTSIGTGAFNKCSTLTSINIPGTVNRIGVSAFNECSGLTSVTIQQGVKTIGQKAFYKCENLTSCTVPNSVTGIGKDAFTQCSAMTSLSIGSGVTNILSPIIARCPSLTSISIDANNTVYDSRDNCNAIIKKSNNTLIGGCKNTVIPADVTSIGEGAFHSCSGLTSITIPSSVTSIGDNAFYSCTGLTEITIPTGVSSIGKLAFDKCENLTSIDIPAGVTSIGISAFQACAKLKDVYVNWTDLSGVTIGLYIFQLITLANVNLHLPFEAWESYNGEPWSGFKQVPMITAKADPENAGVYYNTFYRSSVAYALPTGVEAYTAQRDGTDLILTKIAQAGDVLPAGTAVILKSSVQQFEITPSEETPVTVGENDLQGVDVATPVATAVTSGTCYVLSGPNSTNGLTEVGFYTFSGTLGAHKAYLVVPGSSPAPKHLRFVFDATVDIETVTGNPSPVTEKILRDGILYIQRGDHLYNIQGVRVE